MSSSQLNSRDSSSSTPTDDLQDADNKSDQATNGSTTDEESDDKSSSTDNSFSLSGSSSDISGDISFQSTDDNYSSSWILKFKGQEDSDNNEANEHIKNEDLPRCDSPPIIIPAPIMDEYDDEDGPQEPINPIILSRAETDAIIDRLLDGCDGKFDGEYGDDFDPAVVKFGIEDDEEIDPPLSTDEEIDKQLKMIIIEPQDVQDDSTDDEEIKTICRHMDVPNNVQFSRNGKANTMPELFTKRAATTHESCAEDDDESIFIPPKAKTQKMKSKEDLATAEQAEQAYLFTQHAAMPKNAEPSTSCTKAVMPENAGPSTSGTKAAMPNNAGPSTSSTKATMPENAGPSTSGYKAAMPEYAGPSSSSTKAAMPENAGPSTSGYKAAMPEYAGPSSSSTKAAMPKNAGPSTSGTQAAYNTDSDTDDFSTKALSSTDFKIAFADIETKRNRRFNSVHDPSPAFPGMFKREDNRPNTTKSTKRNTEKPKHQRKPGTQEESKKAAEKRAFQAELTRFRNHIAPPPPGLRQLPVDEPYSYKGPPPSFKQYNKLLKEFYHVEYGGKHLEDDSKQQTTDQEQPHTSSQADSQNEKHSRKQSLNSEDDDSDDSEEEENEEPLFARQPTLYDYQFIKEVANAYLENLKFERPERRLGLPVIDDEADITALLLGKHHLECLRRKVLRMYYLQETQLNHTYEVLKQLNIELKYSDLSRSKLTEENIRLYLDPKVRKASAHKGSKSSKLDPNLPNENDLRRIRCMLNVKKFLGSQKKLRTEQEHVVNKIRGRFSFASPPSSPPPF